MDNPISLKEFSEKYNIYSYSMMRKLYSQGKLISAQKVGMQILIDEPVELKNIEDIKSQGRNIPNKNKQLKIDSLMDN